MDRTAMIEKMYQFLFGYRWFILALAVLIYALSLHSVSSLSMNENIMELLPNNDPELVRYKILLEQFNPMDAMILDIHTPEDSMLPPEELMALADSFAARMASSPHFAKIHHKWTMADLADALKFIKKHRAALFTEQDRAILQDKMRIESIRARLSDLKQQLMEAPSPFMTQQIQSDPLGFDQILLDKLNAAQSMSDSISIFEGYLFTNDLRHLFIIAQSRYKSTDDAGSARVVGFIDSTIACIKGLVPHEPLSISYISSHRFSLENARRIKKDVQLTVTASFIAIAMISLAAYSNPLLVLLSLLPSLFGVTVALGLVGWINPALSAISIGSAALLVGVSADYGCHLLFHADQIRTNRPRGLAVGALMSHFYKPLLLSAATRYAAFICLFLSALPAYHEIGLIGSIAIAVTLLFVLIVLPLLTPIATSSATKRRPWIDLTRVFPRFMQWSSRNRNGLIVAIVLITLLLVPGFIRLQFDGDVQKLNATSPDIQADFADIQKSLGVVLTSTLVMIHGKNMQEALEENDRLSQALTEMKEKGIIQAYNSVSPLIPARQTQLRNQQRWNDFFHTETLERLEKDLHLVCSELRMRSEFFEAFIASLKKRPALFDLQDLPDGLIKDLAANQMVASSTAAAILTAVRLPSEQEYMTLIENLSSFDSRITVYNGPSFVAKMVRIIFNELKRLSLITFLLVIGILWVFIRKLTHVSAMLIPLLLSLFWTFGIMGFLGIQINIMNCIVAVFIFGLIIDESIFLFSACTRDSGSREELGITSGATIISAVTTMAGLGALFIARHPALHALGLTALLGLGTGLCAVFFIIPLFFRKKLG